MSINATALRGRRYAFMVEKLWHGFTGGFTVVMLAIALMVAYGPHP